MIFLQEAVTHVQQKLLLHFLLCPPDALVNVTTVWLSFSLWLWCATMP